MTRTVVLLLALASPAAAQLPPGADCYCWPPGAKAGQAVEVLFGGSDWTPDVQFFCSDPRVKLEQLAPPGEVLVPEPPYWFGIKSFDNDPKLPREVPVRLTLPADLPPGPVRWRVANANGAATGGVFVAGNGVEVTEEEDRKGPQTLSTLPVTINGRLRRIEEIDEYEFVATETGLVTADLFARRIGNTFNGVIRISEGGITLCDAVDTEGTDPTLTFAVEKGKRYTVAVREVDHRGYRNFTYRLALSTGPRVVAAVPAAGRVGDRRVVEFVGYGVATGAAKLERVSAEVEFPKFAGTPFEYRLETPIGTTPVTLPVGDLPERVESDGRKLPGPCGVTGRFDNRGERHEYTFSGRKAEVWELSVFAERLGSPIDATLAVVGPDGKPIAANDDTEATDPRLTVTLPSDGEYRVVVRDLSGKQPDPSFVYRLVVTKPAGGFALKTAGVVSVPIGGKGTLAVQVSRVGGFKEPIALSITGLPDGVSVPKELVIAAGATSATIPLECAATTGTVTAFVTVTGTATIDDRPVTATAVAAEHSSVLLATTMKPPFKVKSPEADGTRKVYRGATHLADLVIERTDGFTGEITLDMAGAQQRHRQGIHGPAFKVAAGVDKVLYPVALPEWLESTRTSRIGLVAMAEIPDPKGVPRWVMTPMEGQVTMSVQGALLKLSSGPEEVTAACGEPASVTLELARSPNLTGPVTVELLPPSELKEFVKPATLEWPTERSTATLIVKGNADPKLVGVWEFTARATGTYNGYPVVSECRVEIEFTRASTNSPGFRK